MSPRSYTLGQRTRAVDQTRARILAAGRALITEVGFHRASMEEVARRADVSRKTIYYQFDSKQGLLQAIVTELEQSTDLVPRIQAIVEQRDARGALPIYFLEVCRFWAGAQQLMRHLHGLAALDPDVAVVLASHDTSRRARLVGYADRLAEQAGLGSELPRHQLVEALWMLTSFGVFDHLTGRSELSVEETAATLTKLAEGILSPPSDRTVRC